MIKNIPHIHEEGVGYLIRTYTGVQFGYWTGAFKESRWGTSIYAAKIYKNREAAEVAIERHKNDCLWEHAEIVKIKFIEEEA